MAPTRILVLEDEAIVGLDLAMRLEDEGYECLGPARSVDEGLALIEADVPDFAVLDANLGGTYSTDVAARLQGLGVPFVYVTGYSDRGVLEDLPKAPRFSKPLVFAHLKAEIEGALRGAGAQVTPPR